MKYKNPSIFLDALQGLNHAGRPPIWMMRQAGRYIPEYRALRKKYSFIEMTHQPEIAAEVTLMPIGLFGFDAAILFSDILVIPEAFGVGLRFEDSVGPIIENPLRSASDVDALGKPNISKSLAFVEKTIQIVSKDLLVPLIGFCGAPFTVASYMIEGGSSKDFKKTKQWMLKDPQSFHNLLKKIAESSIDYLKMQIEAGVQAVQIFDSWAHILAHAEFLEFSLHYLKMILDGISHLKIPAILYSRGSSVFALSLASIKPQAISLDWNGDLAAIRKTIPPHVAIQGNLDPDLLYAPQKTLQTKIKHLLNQMKGDPAYIFNLGHGIHPDTPVESVKTLVETVKTFQ